MLEIFSSMGELFNKSVQSTKLLEGMISANFGNYFKYYRHELAAFDELIQDCNSYRNQFYSASTELKEKKELLYNTKQMNKWELPQNCPYSVDVLLKNKTFAFEVMLGSETRSCNNIKTFYGYYLNKVKEEFTRLCSKNETNMSNHLIDTGGMGCSIFASVFLLIKFY